MCMTRRYFDRNFDALADRFRVVRVDLRSHGDSPASEGSNTVAQYARDLKHLVDTLGLDRPVLAGWSMGTLTIWDAIRQFGSDWIGGHVNISQGPADLVRDDWPMGAFRMEDLHGLLAGAQADYRATMDHVIPLMLKRHTGARRPRLPARRGVQDRVELRHALHPRPVRAGTTAT